MPETPLDDTQPGQTDIRIWQQNLNKSMAAQLHVVNSPMAEHYDLILFQEPFMDQRGNTRATPKFNVVYPSATKIEDRQYITERFNVDERIFAFIASSRSGGVGIK